MSAVRGLKVLAIIAAVITLMIATVWLAIHITNRQSGSSVADTCSTNQPTHVVVIKNGAVSPRHITAPRCDRLTVVNLDNVTRLIAFGQHDKHTPYDGLEERLLAKGQSFTVTLDQAGSFRFHDHLDDAAQGAFTVTS